MSENPDFSIVKFAAGVAGAVVSLRFVQGTWVERGTMAVGGAALSYYATTPLSEWMATPKTEGVVGFFVGLFGMAIVAKIYEVIQLIDAKQVAVDVWGLIKRKWGA